MSTVRLHKRRLFDTVRLLGSYAGRERLRNEATLRLWPAVAPVATAYRRTALRSTPVVVVVGSQGKSTAVRAVRAALGLGVDAWVDANCGAEVGMMLLQGRPWHRAVVLEVGIGAPGQMRSYAAHVRPSHVVVTSVGTEHHGSLGSKERIRSEKAKMVESVPEHGVVFLNADDEHVMWMQEKSRARCVTFGFSQAASVRASDFELEWPRGAAFTLHAGGRVHRVRTRLLSRDLVRGVLAAVAVALDLGEPIEAALARLERLTPTPMRLEPQRLPNGAWLLRDEYKSSLETVDSALGALEEIPVAGRRFVVLGEVSEPPGSQGPIYRGIGARLAAFSHAAVFVGGNFQRYAAGARRASMRRDRLIDAGRSWKIAADYLRRELRDGDVVLIKGRDTQRLDRISLSLLGRDARCELTECDLGGCERCPLLDKATARADEGLRRVS